MSNAEDHRANYSRTMEIQLILQYPATYRSLMVLWLANGCASRKALHRYGPPQRHRDSGAQIEVLRELGWLTLGGGYLRPFSSVLGGGHVRLTEQGTEVAEATVEHQLLSEQFARKVSFAAEDWRRMRIMAHLLYSGAMDPAELSVHVGLQTGLSRGEIEDVIRDLANRGLTFEFTEHYPHSGRKRMNSCGLTGDGIVLARVRDRSESPTFTHNTK